MADPSKARIGRGGKRAGAGRPFGPKPPEERQKIRDSMRRAYQEGRVRPPRTPGPEKQS